MLKLSNLLRIGLPLLVLVSIARAQTPVQLKVDEPTVCFECHDNIAVDLKAKHVHTAMEAGKCSDCHNPHASKHATLLYEQAGELCLTCHEDIKDEINLEHPHQPAAEKGCIDCHEPHSSPNPNQLNASMKGLCSTCHDQVLRWDARAVVHAPVAEAECATCHNAHGSKTEGLLAEDLPGLCLNCHEPDAAFTAKHESSAIAESDCRTCHDPHATDNKSLLRTNQHAPFASGNCGACHDRNAPDASFAVKKTPERLCKMCHRDIGRADGFAGVAHRHSEDRETYCLDCHNPHTSDADHLLAASQRELCVRCHFNSSEYEKPVAEMMTHPGIDCSECHTLHLAGNERFLKSLNSDLCSGCHQGAHSVTHPIGDDIIDPRDGQPMTCLDCHQLHGPDFEYYLPLDPDRALCIQCHKR